MLSWARRSEIRVALVVGLLALVMVASRAEVTVFPTSDERGAGGLGTGYPRYTGPVESLARGAGQGGWSVGPVLGMVVAAGLLALCAQAFRQYRRRGRQVPDDAAIEESLPEGGASATGGSGEAVGASGTADPLSSGGFGVDAAWRRVEELVAGEGGRPWVSRTTARTLREALDLGAPPTETRELARLHDVARYSGRPVSAEVELEAARLADVVVSGRR